MTCSPLDGEKTKTKQVRRTRGFLIQVYFDLDVLVQIDEVQKYNKICRLLVKLLVGFSIAMLVTPWPVPLLFPCSVAPWVCAFVNLCLSESVAP